MTPPGPSSARPAPAGEPRAPGTGLLLMLLAAMGVGASATTLAGLYAAAAVAGVTQAISNPTTNRVIRSVVPAERRIGWIGVKQSGVQVAQLVASLSFPAAALALGWTGASLATAGLAAVLWAAAVAVVPPLPAPSGAVAAVPARTGRPPLPATVWFFAAIALGSMAGVGVFLAADLAHAPALLWAGAAVHGLTVLGANVVTNAGLLDAVPAEHLGRATGVNAMGMYAGFACGPLVMGLLRDLTGDFRLGFAAVGAGYALALVAVLLLRRHTDRAAAGSAA